MNAQQVLVDHGLAPTEGRQRTDWLTFGAVLLALFGYSLLETMVAPALPQIQQALQATPSELGFVFAGPFLAGAVATPLIGALADIFAKRRVLFVTLVVVCVGAALAGCAQNIEMLALGQILQGVGLGMLPLAVGLLGEVLPKNKLAFGNGLMVAAMTSSAALGLVLAGVVVDRLGFRGIYGLVLVVLIPCAIAVFASDRSTAVAKTTTPRSVDWLGALLLALALVALLVGLAFGPRAGWAAPPVLALLAGAMCLFAIWFAFEWRHAKPLFDLALLRKPAVATTCVIVFAVGFASISIYAVMPLLLKANFQADAGTIGLYLLPMGLAGFAAAPFTGMLERALGARGVLVLGAVAVTASAAMPIVLQDKGWHIVATMSMLGVGIALVLTEAMNVVVRVVGPMHAASVSGIVFATRTIGATLGAQISTTLLDTATRATGTVAAATYAHPFMLAAAVAAVAVAAAAFFPRMPAEPST